MQNFVFLLLMIVLLGCQSSIDSTRNKIKYSAYELVGLEKRDLFKKELEKTKESQTDAEESFKDALEKLVTLTQSESKKPEKEFRKLESAFEDADKRSQQVKGRIIQVNQVATDLFKEWADEIKSMSSADLKKKSAKSLELSQQKYDQLYKSLKASEKKMNPVLTKLRDHTLYAKHNLNAHALAGLKNEAADIQKDIDSLVADIQKSIQEADTFIKTLQ